MLASFSRRFLMGLIFPFASGFPIATANHDLVSNFTSFISKLPQSSVQKRSGILFEYLNSPQLTPTLFLVGEDASDPWWSSEGLGRSQNLLTRLGATHLQAGMALNAEALDKTPSGISFTKVGIENPMALELAGFIHNLLFLNDADMFAQDFFDLTSEEKEALVTWLKRSFFGFFAQLKGIYALANLAAPTQLFGGVGAKGNLDLSSEFLDFLAGDFPENHLLAWLQGEKKNWLAWQLASHLIAISQSSTVKEFLEKNAVSLPWLSTLQNEGGVPFPFENVMEELTETQQNIREIRNRYMCENVSQILELGGGKDSHYFLRVSARHLNGLAHCLAQKEGKIQEFGVFPIYVSEEDFFKLHPGLSMALYWPPAIEGNRVKLPQGVVE